MLKTIADFFTSIADVVISLLDFVVGLVEDTVYVVKLCGTFVTKIPVLFSWLPPECLALVVILFSVVVAYKILGREG